MACQSVHTENSTDSQIYTQFTNPLLAEIYANEFAFLFSKDANKEPKCISSNSSTKMIRVQPNNEIDVDKQSVQLRNKCDGKIHGGIKTRNSPKLKVYQRDEPHSFYTKESQTRFNQKEKLKLVHSSWSSEQDLDIKNRASTGISIERQTGDVDKDYYGIKFSKKLLPFRSATSKSTPSRGRNLKQDKINSSSNQNSDIKTTVTISENLNSPNCTYEDEFAFSTEEDMRAVDVLQNSVMYLSEYSAVDISDRNLFEINSSITTTTLFEVSDSEKVEVNESEEEALKDVKTSISKAIAENLGTITTSAPVNRRKAKKNAFVEGDKNRSKFHTYKLSKEQQKADTFNVSENAEKTAMGDFKTSIRKSIDCKVTEEDVKAAITLMNIFRSGKMSMSVANVVKPNMKSSEIEKTRAAISMCKVERKADDFILTNSANKENTKMKADKNRSKFHTYKLSKEQQKADTFNISENAEKTAMGVFKTSIRKSIDCKVTEEDVKAAITLMNICRSGKMSMSVANVVKPNMKSSEIEKTRAAISMCKVERKADDFILTNSANKESTKMKASEAADRKELGSCIVEYLQNGGVNSYSAGAQSNQKPTVLKMGEDSRNRYAVSHSGKINDLSLPKAKQNEDNSERLNKITSLEGSTTGLDRGILKSVNSDEEPSDSEYVVDMDEVRKAVAWMELNLHHISAGHNPAPGKSHLASIRDQNQQGNVSDDFDNVLSELVILINMTDKICFFFNDQICYGLMKIVTIKEEQLFRNIKSGFLNTVTEMNLLLANIYELQVTSTNLSGNCLNIKIQQRNNNLKIASSLGSSLQISLKDLKKTLDLIRDSVFVKGAKEIRLKKIITDILKSLDDLDIIIVKVIKLSI